MNRTRELRAFFEPVTSIYQVFSHRDTRDTKEAGLLLCVLGVLCVDLSGFPDFPAPAAIKEAACAAINADINQYAVTWGARPLREAVAREFTRRLRSADRGRRAGDGVLRIDRSG